MNELRRAGRRAGREILALDETNAKSSSDGIKGDATAGSASADDENVKRIDGAGSDQSRLLDCSRGNDCSRIIDLVPVGLNRVTTGATVIGGERRLKQD